MLPQLLCSSPRDSSGNAGFTSYPSPSLILLLSLLLYPSHFELQSVLCRTITCSLSYFPAARQSLAALLPAPIRGQRISAVSASSAAAAKPPSSNPNRPTDAFIERKHQRQDESGDMVVAAAGAPKRRALVPHMVSKKQQDQPGRQPPPLCAGIALPAERQHPEVRPVAAFRLGHSPQSCDGTPSVSFFSLPEDTRAPAATAAAAPALAAAGPVYPQAATAPDP